MRYGHRIIADCPVSTSRSARHYLVNKSITFQHRTSSFSALLKERTKSVEMSEASVEHQGYSPRSTAGHTEPHLEQASRNSGAHKNHKGPPRKRDTHFLCFPLVTDASIPELARSLRHFREVTTKSTHHGESAKGSDEDETPPREDEVRDGGAGSESNTVGNLGSVALPASNPDLQLLPASAHRPPGTFHLTLGVMDLSTQEVMQRALRLLEELDYAEIFCNTLEQHPSNGSNHAKAVQAEVKSQSHIASGQDAGTHLSSFKRPITPPQSTKFSSSLAPNFSKDRLPHILLTGLSTFPSAKTSRVFYAKPCPVPTSCFPLLEFAKAIRRQFHEAGLIKETRPLVLHATVANMKYAVSPKGGRTSKGKTWRYGKDRWSNGQIDAREIIKCFDCHAGDVEEYTKGGSGNEHDREFIWADNIVLNRVAICKMGAENSDDEVLGKIYPPIGEKLIFS